LGNEVETVMSYKVGIILHVSKVWLCYLYRPKSLYNLSKEDPALEPRDKDPESLLTHFSLQDRLG